MWNWLLRGMKNKEEGKGVNMILDPFAFERQGSYKDYRKC